MANDIEALCKNYGIGITGGIGTGKSTFAKILSDFGYHCADADQFSRQVMAPGQKAYNKLVAIYGQRILKADHTIDRSLLKEHVFTHIEAKKKLEALVHPEIKAAFFHWLRVKKLTDKPSFFFYEATLIIETKSVNMFRELWLTTCSQETQIKRINKRDSIDEKSILAIIKTQMPDAEKKIYADVIIDTGIPLAKLKDKALGLIDKRLLKNKDI